MSAFSATLAETGAKGCTIVADKGFFSKANVSAMDAASRAYVLPLMSNIALVDTSFLDDEQTRSFDGCFEYHGRVIWHKTVGVG